jgi:ABC-type glycerol-3-phosphate transport system substrate-binding protein
MWGGRGIASGGEWPTYSGLTFLWQNGADAFSPDGSRTDGYLNSPQAAEAMRWLGELYHRYHFTHFDPIPASFPERAAMSLSMQNDFFYLWEHYPNLEWGLIPLPYNARKASPHGDWGLTITTQSKYPKEAWEFIRNVFTVENQTKLASTVCTPVLRGLYHTIPDFKEEQAFQIVYEQLDKTAMTRPRTPAYPKFSREFTKAYQRVAKGEDAKKALDEAVHEIDEDIRNHGGYEEERFEKALKVAVR